MFIKSNKWLFFLFFLMIWISSFAPNTAKKYKYKAFFGCHYSDEISLETNTFKEFMKRPFCAKYSNNNFFKVNSFELMYAERGLYQDDEGLPIIYTDYTSDRFVGDTLNAYWKNIFSQRLYKDDTVYFEKITCIAADNKHYECKPIKIILK